MTAELDTTDGIDTSKDTMKTAPAKAMLDSLVREACVDQLTARYDPVLTRRKLPNTASFRRVSTFPGYRTD
jgi:hypothetical protein